MKPTKRIILGISGASGGLYARRTLQLLLEAGVETHLVISPAGQRVLHDELGVEGADVASICGDDRQARAANVIVHHYRDVGAPIASGSLAHDGMVIVPCSLNSLASVANGLAGNLLHRAAAVALKERRRLVLVVRETPLSLVDIRNMERATEAGAIVCPANPAFYMLPRTVMDVVDSVVGRVLDLLGVEHQLAVRWGQVRDEAMEGEE
ncbi:MAG: UbiX family flavin prenyltransferase [Phycisphaeraceae bacterium]|nr:UbiX family flavin prenyltransferase [Phycisphaeraceae bacterium]